MQEVGDDGKLCFMPNILPFLEVIIELAAGPSGPYIYLLHFFPFARRALVQVAFRHKKWGFHGFSYFMYNSRIHISP